MNKSIILVLVIIIVAVLIYTFWGQNAEAPVENNMPVTGSGVPETAVETVTPAQTTAAPQVASVTVTYSDSGFASNSVEIKIGDSVSFANKSTQKMWVGSAMHPTHAVYSGTNLTEHCPDADNNDFDQCVGSDLGTSWSFTFNKAGTWRYHNHMNTSHFGTVIVK